MAKARKPKEAEPKWETHVYLDEAVHKHLEQVAADESRSVNGQILHFIKRGLAEHDKGRR